MNLASLFWEWRNIPFRLVCLSCFAFLSACFDYHEKLELKEDFSGSVTVTYTVPVSKEGTSRLSFLPVNQRAIKTQYEGVVPGIRFHLRNIKISPVELGPEIKKGNKHSKVSYRLEFKDPKILEYTPLANTKVLKSEGYLQIRRTFPALQNIKRAKGVILKRIAKYLRKRFVGHSISYSAFLPEDFELYSNKGRFSEDTEHSYALFLVETLDSAKDIQWSFSLKRD